MPRFRRARAFPEDVPFTLSNDRLAGIVTQSRTDGAAVIESFQLRRNDTRGGVPADAGSPVFASSVLPAAYNAA